MRTRGLRRQYQAGLGTACLALSALSLAGFFFTAACAHPPASAKAPASSSVELAPGGSPFAGLPMYRAPYSNAENAQRRLEKTNPAEAALVAKIAAQPQASWYGGWSGDIKTVVTNYVN